MQRQDGGGTVDEVTGTNRRLGPWVVIAAVLAVVIGAVVWFVVLRGADLAPEASAVDLATEYVEAYATFDVDRVESMLAEDATVLPWESWEPRDWQTDLRYLEAAGLQISDVQCREVPSSDDELLVNCAYRAHALGSDRMGQEPFSGHEFQLAIDDGRVTSSDMGFDFHASGFTDAVWWPFRTWMEESHPDDLAVLYEDETLTRQTDDAIALWAERLDEYLESRNSQP